VSETTVLRLNGEFHSQCLDEALSAHTDKAMTSNNEMVEHPNLQRSSSLYDRSRHDDVVP
jgi:hypothetical protein